MLTRTFQTICQQKSLCVNVILKCVYEREKCEEISKKINTYMRWEVGNVMLRERERVVNVKSKFMPVNPYQCMYIRN